jgi:peptidoglycan-associated lipoprotein
MVGLLASCASKKKTDDDSQAAAANADTKISNEALNMDAQGSDSGKIAGLTTIFFEYDQSRLTSEARRILAENANWIKSHPGVVQIEGHTDERGSTEYNLALGERRAKAVREYLVSLGLSSKKMSTISYGEERPLMKGSSEEAYAKNRRANFVPGK